MFFSRNNCKYYTMSPYVYVVLLKFKNFAFTFIYVILFRDFTDYFTLCNSVFFLIQIS